MRILLNAAVTKKILIFFLRKGCFASANIKDKNSEDAVIVGSSLTLHNSLFFIDKITI